MTQVVRNANDVLYKENFILWDFTKKFVSQGIIKIKFCVLDN